MVNVKGITKCGDIDDILDDELDAEFDVLPNSLAHTNEPTKFSLKTFFDIVQKTESAPIVLFIMAMGNLENPHNSDLITDIKKISKEIIDLLDTNSYAEVKHTLEFEMLFKSFHKLYNLLILERLQDTIKDMYQTLYELETKPSIDIDSSIKKILTPINLL